MSLNLWIGSSIVSIIIFYFYYFCMVKDLKKYCTKEEIKLFAKNNKSGGRFYLSVFFVPILNIFLVLVFIKYYEYMRDELIENIRTENELNRYQNEIYK